MYINDVDFSETIQVKAQWRTIFKVLEGKKVNLKLYTQKKIFYKWMQNKGFFPDIQKLKNLAKVDLC